MRHEQKIVARGALAGVASMGLLVYVLYHMLPPVAGVVGMADRVVFALQMNVIAVVPFFVMVMSVGNRRFFGGGINPLDHREDPSLEIDGRVADNTLQQNFLFFVGTLALASILDDTEAVLLAALTIVFVLARIAFWIGYRIHPLYRAPGMAATSYMNFGILVYVLYSLL